MSITFLLIATPILLAGTAFVLAELENAPEGFQTDEGFNLVWKNNSPERENVSLVWAVQSPRPAA
jgi:hypothetical protein